MRRQHGAATQKRSEMTIACHAIRRLYVSILYRTSYTVLSLDKAQTVLLRRIVNKEPIWRIER